MNITFSFGKNWQNYLKSLTKQNIRIAKNSLSDYLGNIERKTILDIGCGSGIFSYCMYILGAKRIVSFDIDPFSVQCTEFLHSKVKNPEKWEIYQGSILDIKLISRLEKFDIVYSWGVLHHTGKMWEAINNTISLVKDNGLLLIAIYNKTNSSKFWLEIKKIYNIVPKLGKNLMNLLYFTFFNLIFPILYLKNPIKLQNEHHKKRGMNIFIDIKDWLGGYPYEYASFEEVIDFIISKKYNYKLIKYTKVNGTGNNIFLFKKLNN